MMRRVIVCFGLGLMLFGLSFLDEPAAADSGYALRLELAQKMVDETARQEAVQLAQWTSPGEDPEEDAKIEAELTAQGYYRDDIPMTYQEQDFLHTACEESGVEYALALGVIRQETGFRNVVGDDGASEGYMQVQERWHRERMAALGVTDLSDPYGNFRVGCDYLAELLGRYDGDLDDALTAYNSGRTGSSEYSRAVIGYMEQYIS